MGVSKRSLPSPVPTEDHSHRRWCFPSHHPTHRSTPQDAARNCGSHPTHRGHQRGVRESQTLQVCGQAAGHDRGGRHRLGAGRGDCGQMRKTVVRRGNMELAQIEQGSGSRRFSTMDSGACGSLVALTTLHPSPTPSALSGLKMCSFF